MQDQAARLREIATEIYGDREILAMPERNAVASAKVIAVTSGKGGVGKTNISVNLALKLQEYGAKVLLVDTDIAFANADIIMGISPQFNLSDAILKNYPVKDVIQTAPGNIHFLPGGSGIADLFQQPESKRSRVLRQLEELERLYDYMIIDTPAGLNKHVLDYLTFASNVYVVATPEPTSIADAYAMVKVLTLQQRKLPVHILVNQVKSADHGKEIFSKFKLVVDKFLKIRVYYLGHVVSDKNVMRAVLNQQPLVREFPGSPASLCLENIAERIVTRGNSDNMKKNESFFKKVGKFSIFH